MSTLSDSKTRLHGLSTIAAHLDIKSLIKRLFRSDGKILFTPSDLTPYDQVKEDDRGSKRQLLER